MGFAISRPDGSLNGFLIICLRRVLMGVIIRVAGRMSSGYFVLDSRYDWPVIEGSMI